MFDPITQSAIDQELTAAAQARQADNEGKARVCARRAAGIALRAYFAARRVPFTDPSAYALLNRLVQLPSTPPEIVRSANALLTRVTTDYQLPIPLDLIALAREIIDWIAGQIEGDPHD